MLFNRGDVIVPVGETLTLTQGSQFAMATNSDWLISGQLASVGRQIAPIKFTLGRATPAASSGSL